MPRLTDKIREKIVADYHIGMTQNALHIKYDVSKATIHKLVSGLPRKNVENVNTLTRMAIDLAQQTEAEVFALSREVSQKTSDMEFFRDATLLVTKKVVDKVRCEDLSMFDLEKAQSVIGKGKENIYGKVPDTAIQINNQSKESEAPSRPQVNKEEWLKLHGVG